MGANKKHYIFEEQQNNELLKELSKDTLFLPDYIKTGVGMKANKTIDEKDLMEKYEYKYKVLNAELLSDKILNSNKNTFVFSYIYFASQKFLTIYEAKSGSIVFSSYETRAMNGLNNGDFKEISKKVSKAAK